ncbi:hypothetical protein [Lonepinella sp. BR2271]|uniref:hypothetical protein n=1 Tax=Lonepinella sp. BR2271 TaxID=3434550 RepID=UPI003F6E0AF5
MAMESNIVALVSLPIAIEFMPDARAVEPTAVAKSCDALASAPSAVELFPVACVF